MISGSTLSINASIDMGDDYLLVIKNDMHEPNLEEFEQEERKTLLLPSITEKKETRYDIKASATAPSERT